MSIDHRDYDNALERRTTMHDQTTNTPPTRRLSATSSGSFLTPGAGAMVMPTVPCSPGTPTTIAFDGSHTKGRREIASSHQQLFDKYLKGTRLTGRIESVRFPSPDVALVHTVGSTVMRGKSKPSPERDSIQTLVATRSDGGWLFAAFHNNRVRPIGRNPATFLIWALTDLLWKVFAPRRKDDA